MSDALAANAAHSIIVDFLASCVEDPLKYVMGAFPWESDRSIQKVKLDPAYKSRFPGCTWGPDKWQCEYLDQLGEEIRRRKFNGHDPVAPIRMSTVSGHGIGKSTISAWIVKFILDTRPYSVGTMTANTAAQLRTKTWAELGKWHSISITKDWFVYTASSTTLSIVHADKAKGLRWKCFGQTCDPNNSESFAGQHSDATSFYVFDEASKVDDIFFEVREGGMKAGEPMVFDFGNGTRNSGRFKENCVGKFRHQYIVRSIDSRSVARTNKEAIAEEVEMYGEDSDYIRVRVRGLFPKQASTQFIGQEEVIEAQSRLVPATTSSTPLYIGVDVALQGADSTVIYPRVGNDARTFPPRQFRGLDPEQIANEVKDYVLELKQVGYRTAGIFIDGGGGYGSGVHTHLRSMGIHATLVYPGRRALKPNDYGNRITELWAHMRDAIRSGLCLPESTSRIGRDLYDEIVGREAGETLAGQVRLTSKQLLESSPDIADALALTFAREIVGDNTAPAGVQFIKFNYGEE